MPRITKRVVDAAQPRATRYMVWDSEIRGFGLLIMPSGVKSYRLDYRTPENVQRRITIGRHGEGDWTAETARRKAEDYRKIVRDGGDPLGAKQDRRNAVTVNDVIDAYLESPDFTDNSPTSQDVDRGRFERHIRPLLGKKRVHLVSEDDVKRAFAAIRDGKTAADVKTGKPRGRSRVRGGPGAAREAIVRLSVAFNWAVLDKLMKENPAANIKLPPVGARDTILEDSAGYKRLFETLDKMERELRIAREAADAIRVIALTGARRNEIAALRWRYVEGDRIVYPPQKHKAGRRTGKTRVIVLPTTAQAIISRQPEGEPDDYVFTPSRGDGGCIDLSHVFAKVRAEAKLPGKLCLHGLRHSTGSHLAMDGAEGPQIMTALGHSQISTTLRYIHFGRAAKSNLAEQAAAVAIAGMAAATRKPGKVVKLKGGRR